MAFTKTFNNNLSELIKANTSDSSIARKIPARLAAFAEKIKPHAEDGAAADESTNEISIKHQLTFPPYLNVDKNVVLAMNEIFKQENKLANQMLATLNDRPVDPQDIVKRRDVLHRTAVSALVTE